ncbi:uncharacterized protein LOC132579683 isoform X3 [Heteronotia binoei]|uniref:uncharacterized protein LOC132579683 isoform X3 n=1 Tax=Heteronotia binoei TaxID=13085 RepID=UPI00292F2B26|nr:uncharacterized protein LOC132579683 isoform X3 [Heteronotia binoei]
MGCGGLYVLVLLGLLVVATERNKAAGAGCWVKGNNTTIHPQQCPAEYQGANANFCCRLCYGPNCCVPGRPPKDTCLPKAWMYRAVRDRRRAPDVKIKDTQREEVDLLLLAFIIVAVFLIATVCFYPDCIRCLKFCWNPSDREEQAQPRVNIPSSRVLFHNPPRSNDLSDFLPRPYTIPRGDPPPYSLVDPQRPRDLPPPYPGQSAEDPQEIRSLPLPYSEGPVVAFHHSRSQAQDDTVEEVAATGTAQEEVDWPGVAATGTAQEEVDWPGVAATGTARKEVDWAEAAASDGAPDADLLEAAVSGGAPKLPE